MAAWHWGPFTYDVHIDGVTPKADIVEDIGWIIKGLNVDRREVEF